jgi:SAM-dependent methyltransferase
MAVDYQVHLEELTRFRRYVHVNIHVRPQLLPEASAYIDLKGRRTSLEISNNGDVSVLTQEFIAPTSGVPAHEARLIIKPDPWQEIDLGSIIDRRPRDEWHDLNARFAAQDFKNNSILEIGSRTRHATEVVARNTLFADPSIDYTGLDIVEGPNVDVVGDAHRLTEYFPEKRFDLIFSNWVFEHLMMPWVAVLEINKVLKPAGEVFVNTNHSIALHDLPWDFFRFSKWSWIGLFNRFTGFEIIESHMGAPVRLTPMRYDDSFRDHEGGIGHQACGVWARKIAEPSVEWKVDSSELAAQLSRAYPAQITD